MRHLYYHDKLDVREEKGDQGTLGTDMEMETKSCRGCGWNILINHVKNKLMDELPLFVCGIRCTLMIRNKEGMQR